MDISEKEIFTFTWRIENFSFCPHWINERVCSPKFVVDFLNKSEWEIWIYPRGTKTDSEMCFALLLVRAEDSTEKLAVGFKFVLNSVTGKNIEITSDYAFKWDKGWCFYNLATREDIFNTENGHLPNDTLTITCKIWRKADGNSSVITSNAHVSLPDCNDSDFLKQMRVTEARDELLNFRTQFSSNQCLVVTRIKIGKKSILWPIRKFSELPLNKKLTIPVMTALTVDPLFFLTLFLTDERGNEFVNIEIKKHPDSDQKYFVKCKIVAFNAMNTHRYMKEDKHYFDSKSENLWEFPRFIDVKNLRKQKYCNFDQDIIYLHCEIAFSTPEDLFHIQTTDIVSVPNSIPHLFTNTAIGSVFRNLSINDELTDIIIQTKDKEFKAHKIVLATQSPVFKAMFLNDMVEKKKGIVNITDIDKSTMGNMLDFMYGKDLQIYELEDAEKLYSVAGKYQILPLKWSCSCFLKTNLSVTNVCSVLTLSHLYQDNDLMDETQNFIRLHSSEIFYSQTWAEYMKSNPELAVDIMVNMSKN